VRSPKLGMEARGGVSHYRNIYHQFDYGTNASSAVGVPGVNLKDLSSGLVGVTLGKNFISLFVGYATNALWHRGESNIDRVTSWTWILGSLAEVRREGPPYSRRPCSGQHV
jgi:hypothetical protein